MLTENSDYTSAKDTVGPGWVEVLWLDDGDRNTGVRREERESITDHLVLKILADRKICDHWKLNIAQLLVTGLPQIGVKTGNSFGLDVRTFCSWNVRRLLVQYAWQLLSAIVIN